MSLSLRYLVRRTMVASLLLLTFFTNASASEAVNEKTTAGIVELLVSDRSEEVARGENLLAAQRSAIFSVLLERIRTGDANTKGKAACEIELMISPWIRGKEAGSRFYEFTSFETPRRPVGKVPKLAESAEIRQSLQVAISTLFDGPAAKSPGDYWQALNALCEALGEVANDETMDWAIDRLQQVKSIDQADRLITLANSYLGIPLIFRRGGYCGNSSPAEIERFQASQKQEMEEACTKLRALWQEVRPMNKKDRIAFAIKSWRDHFVPIQRSSSGHYLHQGWLFQEMEPLIRLGIPAVDQLRAQQLHETVLEVKGVWEVVIATITGTEDSALMRALFDGNDAHRELACEVVVGATSKKWLQELDELQYRGGFDTSKATKAIADCHRDEGIPALKKVLASRPSNFTAEYAIKELEARANRGPPRRMHRYQFR